MLVGGCTRCENPQPDSEAPRSRISQLASGPAARRPRPGLRDSESAGLGDSRLSLYTGKSQVAGGTGRSLAGPVRSGQVRYVTRQKPETMRVTTSTHKAAWATSDSEVSTVLNLATLELIGPGVAQHSPPNYELCHETSDSENVPLEERAGASFQTPKE
jgi:hypothetical protein